MPINAALQRMQDTGAAGSDELDFEPLDEELTEGDEEAGFLSRARSTRWVALGPGLDGIYTFENAVFYEICSCDARAHMVGGAGAGQELELFLCIAFGLCSF